MWPKIGRFNKWHFAFIPVGFAIVFLVLALLLTNSFWQAFFCNTSSSVFVLGIGIAIVNIYLDRGARKGVAKVLRKWAIGSIDAFQDALNRQIWAMLGKEEWDLAVREYLNADFRPEAIKQNSRDAIYEEVKKGGDLKNRYAELGETLTELAYLSGWDFDAMLLQNCIDSRVAIGKLRVVSFDDSRMAKDLVTANIIDIYAYSDNAKQIMNEIAGDMPYRTSD
jgi:hypothetical protein